MLVEIKKVNKEEVIVVSSIDVAEAFEKEHKHVMEDIRRISESINTASFSTLFNLTSYVASNGKTNPMYQMKKDGFILLAMSYTGEKAMKFKLAYINQFNEMEKILKGKLVEREKGIAVRQALTNSLKISQENERMNGHAYSTYTNAIYKILFDKSASQLRKEYGLSKNDDLRNCFSREELISIQSMECLVSGLVDCGWGYKEIKDFISKNSVKKISSF